MILDNKDLEQEEFLDKIIPLDNKFKEYMIQFIIPEAVAFYLKECYYKNCLYDCSIDNHINSSFDLFLNYRDYINDLIPYIEKILSIKYNLKIVNTNPLKFQRIN